MPWFRILRLGLRQFAAGMLSVLALGILNRVMKVEMGQDLGIVGLIVGAHYFAAPFAVPVGHRSDYRPYFGLHRTPYILAGALLTSLCTALAPFAAFYVAESGAAGAAVFLGCALFLIMGLGMFSAGAAYLSLIADVTPEAERGKAVSVVWSMLMLGILGGVFLGVRVMADYTPEALVRLFGLMALLQFLLTLAAVWGQEGRSSPRPSEEALTFGEAVGLLARGRQTRLFFLFLCSGIFFLFLQQAVLEPFGGDVFGLGVSETTRFNAYQMVGVLAGMGAAGGFLSRRLGPRQTAALGLVVGGAAFFLLALAAAAKLIAMVRPSILVMGLGLGIFTVGGLSLMMGMTAAGRVGLYMGFWTLCQAIANGLATVGGGVLHDAALAHLGSEPAAYAAVFAVEAGGLALTLLLLARISVASFRGEAAAAAD